MVFEVDELEDVGCSGSDNAAVFVDVAFGEILGRELVDPEAFVGGSRWGLGWCSMDTICGLGLPSIMSVHGFFLRRRRERFDDSRYSLPF